MIEQTTYCDTVLESAKEVFETMIFMEIEPADPASTDRQSHSLMGTITFKGSIEGCLGISLSKPCAQTIARNMLAMEPDCPISDEEVFDAIGEVANMVMGSIKSRLHDSHTEIEVSIPSVVIGKELTHTLGERAEQTQVAVSIDEEYEAVFTFLFRVNQS